MPLYFRKQKGKNRQLDQGKVKKKTVDAFLSATPASLKGSFLRNKLENPLFKRKRRNPELTKSTEDSDSDNEDYEEDSDESRSVISIHRSDEETSKSVSKKSSRFGSSFFRRRRTKERHISSSSSSSNDSTASSEDIEIETLSKLEDENNNSSTNSVSYLLYTQKGQPVRVKFCYDYLLITPVYSKLSIATRRGKVQDCKTIYYEDLALWTNNEECLRLVHIKNKETALQEKKEIKLYVSKKKRQVTLQEINQDLKDKISLLLSNKKNIPLMKAEELIDTNNTQADIKKVVKQIDRSTEKAIVRNYSNQNFELLNV